MAKDKEEKKKKPYKSEATKKLEKAKVGQEDMPGFKELVRKGALGFSRGLDKIKGPFMKDKEEKEYAKGGAVKKYNKGGMGLEDDNLDSAMDKFRERAKQRQAQGKTTRLSDMSLVDQYEQARRMGRFSGTFKEFLDSREKPEEEKRKGGMAGGYAKGGAAKAFKPCSGCPTPAKCKKAGKCLMKEKAKMPSKGSKKPTGGMLVIPVRLAKAPAKKGKKG
jgi:hypothetical protein